MQDHSCLGNYTSRETVIQFCNEVLEYGFAAVYVNPSDVKLAKSIIGDKAHVGTVIGFPQGVTTTETKIFEGLNAIENGADELDIVNNVSKLKDGNLDYCRDELTRFVKAMKEKDPNVCVKVIIECYYLTHAEKIAIAKIVADAGADFVKAEHGHNPGQQLQPRRRQAAQRPRRRPHPGQGGRLDRQPGGRDRHHRVRRDPHRQQHCPPSGWTSGMRTTGTTPSRNSANNENV